MLILIKVLNQHLLCNSRSFTIRIALTGFREDEHKSGISHGGAIVPVCDGDGCCRRCTLCTEMEETR